MPNTGKLIRLDYDALSLFDTTDVAIICLNQKQVGILKSLLKPAYWSTRWENLGVSQDALEAEITALEHCLDGGNCEGATLEFRDNPADLCEVQYSHDDGETWATMFRKDNCVVPSVTMYTDIENSKTTITNNMTTYDGDIINVAPGWEYEGEDTDAALCMAIRLFVDWVCGVAIASLGNGNNITKDFMRFWDDIGEELSLEMIAYAATVNLPAAAIMAVAWAGTNNLVEKMEDLLEDEAEAFENEDAKEDVRCWMYNSMRGGQITFEAWAAALDTYVAPTTEAEDISDQVKLWLDDEDLYVQYLILVDDLTTLPGELPECDCPTDLLIDQLWGPEEDDYFGARFCHSTSEVYSNPGDTPALGPAYYQEEYDRYVGIASSIGGKCANLYVQLPVDKLVIKVQVAMSVYNPIEATEGDKNAGLWLGNPNDGGTYIGGHSWLGTPEQTEEHTITVEDEAGILETPENRLYIHNSGNRPTGWCTVYWIHIEMIDYEP